MKLVRFGDVGSEQPGLIDDNGRVRSLIGHIPDVSGATLSGSSLEYLKSIDPNSLPLVDEGVRIGSPVGQIGKIICIGLNYRLHAEEAKLPVPEQPIFFMKAVSALNGPNDDIVMPMGAKKMDWEVELGIVIGERASYVSEDRALDYVAGFSTFNDVSEREFQLERGSQWTKGKCCDTFAPLGPWLVTKDEVGDPQNLELWLEVNGERMQHSNTSDMIFNVKEIVSYVSQYMSLQPGDIIVTGTPSGVAAGFNPPRFLKAGDKIKLSVEGLGTQESVVIPLQV